MVSPIEVSIHCCTEPYIYYPPIYFLQKLLKPVIIESFHERPFPLLGKSTALGTAASWARKRTCVRFISAFFLPWVCTHRQRPLAHSQSTIRLGSDRRLDREEKRRSRFWYSRSLLVGESSFSPRQGALVIRITTTARGWRPATRKTRSSW